MLKYALILLFTNLSLFSQDDFLYNGKIIDSVSKEPLAYVNIGIVDYNLGTVSDENGKFELIIKTSDQDLLIRYSYIGYTSKTFN